MCNKNTFQGFLKVGTLKFFFCIALEMLPVAKMIIMIKIIIKIACASTAAFFGKTCGGIGMTFFFFS